MGLHNATDSSQAYAERWYFAELSQRERTFDPGAVERFLLLDRSDVAWIVESTRQHVVGRTWSGLHRLMERNGHNRVSEIGAAAAASWASHLELVARSPRTPQPS